VKTIEMDDANLSLANYVRRAGEEPFVVTDHGKPVAVLPPLENTDLETASLSSNPRFLELIERPRSRLSREGGIPSAEVRRRLGLG
jgi:prevent-host-death family protein